MAMDTRKYIPPHLRESYADATPEDQAWTSMEADAEVQTLLKRYGKRDKEFGRKVAARLFNALQPPKLASEFDVGDE